MRFQLVSSICVVLRSAVLCCVVLCWVVLCCVVRGVVQCAVQCSAVQCGQLIQEHTNTRAHEHTNKPNKTKKTNTQLYTYPHTLKNKLKEKKPLNLKNLKNLKKTLKTLKTLKKLKQTYLDNQQIVQVSVKVQQPDVQNAYLLYLVY